MLYMDHCACCAFCSKFDILLGSDLQVQCCPLLCSALVPGLLVSLLVRFSVGLRMCNDSLRKAIHCSIETLALAGLLPCECQAGAEERHAKHMAQMPQALHFGQDVLPDLRQRYTTPFCVQILSFLSVQVIGLPQGLHNHASTTPRLLAMHLIPGFR